MTETRIYKTRDFNMRLEPKFHEILLKIKQKNNWSNKDLLVNLYEDLQFLYVLMGDKFTLEKGKQLNPLELEKIKEINYMVRL